MKPIEALEYLERVTEVAADIDPNIRKATLLLASCLGATKLDYITALHDTLDSLERTSTDFVLGVLSHLTLLPKGAFEELIPALQAARKLLGKEMDDEVSSD